MVCLSFSFNKIPDERNQIDQMLHISRRLPWGLKVNGFHPETPSRLHMQTFFCDEHRVTKCPAWIDLVHCLAKNPLIWLKDKR